MREARRRRLDRRFRAAVLAYIAAQQPAPIPPPSVTPQADLFHEDRGVQNIRFDAFWKAAGPQMRGRSSKAKARAAWENITKRTHPAMLQAALERYVANDPDYPRSGGPALDKWLRDGRHTNWL